MSTPRGVRALAAAALLAVLPGCEAIDDARDRFGTTDTLSVAGSGTGLMLGLQAPGRLEAGDEGVLRLSVTNRSDTTVTDIRLELIVPGWAEPMAPRRGDREVTMARSDDGGTRFSYDMHDTPIDPGTTEIVDQRIRVPAVGADGQPTARGSRLVRGRLLDADGQALAEVQGEIGLDGVPGDTTSGAVADNREQVGPIRLGMTRAALAEIAPATTDTTWTRAGSDRRGAWVPLGDDGRALAELDGDSVVRLEVRQQGVRTRERQGVGSTLEELRSAYGAACAAVEDDAVVVRFASAPGVTFALDAPVPDDAAGLRANPDQLPGTARVTSWWLQRGGAGCTR